MQCLKEKVEREIVTRLEIRINELPLEFLGSRNE